MRKEQLSSSALLLLRLALGAIFIVHGAQKIFGEGGVAGLVPMIEQLNFVPPLFWAWVLALTEAVGGLFLVLGVLPRISAALIGVVMIVAILKVHGANGFFAGQGGFEYQLLILAVCVAIVLAGSGKFSIFNKC